MQVVLVQDGTRSFQDLLDASRTESVLSEAAQPTTFQVVKLYLAAGVEHILIGYDHIAFLIAIVLYGLYILGEHIAYTAHLLSTSKKIHARLWHPFSKSRWRRVWVRYWESQGIPEEVQMRWADEADAEEDLARLRLWEGEVVAS